MYDAYFAKNHFMSIGSVCKWYVSIGFIIICSIKFIIRPYIPLSDEWQLITDISPNLVGTILIPFGAFWLLKGVFKMNTSFEVQQICLKGFVLVLINEYLQLIPIFGRTFDYLDIIASIPGSYIGYIFFMYKWKKIENAGITTI